MPNTRAILFEPWNLGDALIAFAIALQDPERLAVACNSKWHTLLSAAAQGRRVPDLIAVDLGYVSRNRSSAKPIRKAASRERPVDILSIRGDLRDYHAAYRLFPGSRIRMNGWTSFLAKRSALIDLPFSKGWLSIRNRYKAWAEIADVSWERVSTFYNDKRWVAGGFSLTIHIGAQWGSKQYPHVASLLPVLEKQCSVQIVAGPRDRIPEGIEQRRVARLVDAQLIEALEASTHVITNDSGPMHLAALLRCRTMVMTRQVSIKEWLPPGVVALESEQSPKGYGQNASYLSDEVCDGWPSCQEVLDQLNSCWGSDLWPEFRSMDVTSPVEV